MHTLLCGLLDKITCDFAVKNNSNIILANAHTFDREEYMIGSSLAQG